MASRGRLWNRPDPVIDRMPRGVRARARADSTDSDDSENPGDTTKQRLPNEILLIIINYALEVPINSLRPWHSYRTALGRHLFNIAGVSIFFLACARHRLTKMLSYVTSEWREVRITWDDHLEDCEADEPTEENCHNCRGYDIENMMVYHIVTKLHLALEGIGRITKVRGGPDAWEYTLSPSSGWNPWRIDLDP